MPSNAGRARQVQFCCSQATMPLSFKFSLFALLFSSLSLALSRQLFFLLPILLLTLSPDLFLLRMKKRAVNYLIPGTRPILSSHSFNSHPGKPSPVWTSEDSIHQSWSQRMIFEWTDRWFRHNWKSSPLPWLGTDTTRHFVLKIANLDGGTSNKNKDTLHTSYQSDTSFPPPSSMYPLSRLLFLYPFGYVRARSSRHLFF
jgi:hypothetical protein